MGSIIEGFFDGGRIVSEESWVDCNFEGIEIGSVTRAFAFLEVSWSRILVIIERLGVRLLLTFGGFDTLLLKIELSSIWSSAGTLYSMSPYVNT